MIDAMSNVKALLVVTEPETFTRNQSGSVVGRIYLRLDGEYFPDNQWFDFPVPVLSWWMESLLRVLTGQQTECELLFMDGPQFLHLAASSPDVWSVAFLRDSTDRRPEPPFSPEEPNRHKEGVQHEYEISAKPFMNSLLETAGVVIEECGKRDWHSQDIDELGRLRERLLAL